MWKILLITPSWAVFEKLKLERLEMGNTDYLYNSSIGRVVQNEFFASIPVVYYSISVVYFSKTSYIIIYSNVL